MITSKKFDSTTHLFLNSVLKSLGESSTTGKSLTTDVSLITELCLLKLLDFTSSSLRRKSERFGRLSLILRSSDLELSLSRRSMTRGLR